MRICNCGVRSRLSAAIVVLSIPAAFTTAGAGTRYRIEKVGDGRDAVLNNEGAVLSRQHGKVWRSGSWTSLPDVPVAGTGERGAGYLFSPVTWNDPGQIIGSALPAPIYTFLPGGPEPAPPLAHPGFILGSDNTYTRLPLPPGMSGGVPVVINNWGWILAYDPALGSGTPDKWFLFDGTQCGPMGGPADLIISSINAINDGGAILMQPTDMSSGIPRVATAAVLNATGLISLGAPPNHPICRGIAMNNAGMVVGAGGGPSFSLQDEPFVWSGGRLASICNPDGKPVGRAIDVNEYGVVLAEVRTGMLDFHRPFLWRGGHTIDVMAAIDLQPYNFVHHVGARGINDRGQILFECITQSDRSLFLLTPEPPATPPTRLVNVSARGMATDESSLIAGFYVAGGGTSLLLRAVGPGLLPYGVHAPSIDPWLGLCHSGRDGRIDDNDDWATTGDSAGVSAAADRVGAFSLPARSLDAALLKTLTPGGYTIHTGGAIPERGGTVLLEAYDAGTATSAGRLVNASMRMTIGRFDDVGIVGFALAGERPAKVLLRAVGPTLAEFGVHAPLADPVMFLHCGQEAVLGNDNWGSAAGFPLMAARAAEVGAFALPDGSKDAALLLELEPGCYTIHVAARDGGAGVVLAEIYLLPD
jgi:hypothetical protein